MTSKSSFLISMKENNKRRIWVWVVSFLGQLVLYPGILTVYLSRINFWNEDGVYKLPEHYRIALQEAAVDALGFQPMCMLPVAILAILIAVQGFSYLYDRKKVDMYHSVPVSAKRRFAVIYLNGFLMYIIPALFGICIGILMAAAQGSLTIRCLAECGLAFILNLLYFLTVYHTTILAVMLTGNVVITGFATVILLGIGYIAYAITEALQNVFFDNWSYFFVKRAFTGSVIMDYDVKIYWFKNLPLLEDIVKTILPVYGKWFLAAALLLALSLLCYRKRPSEAAGRAMAFRPLNPFIKIIVSVVAGLVVCYIVYDATYYNIVITALSTAGGTLLCCIVMEAIYEADIRGAFKHLVSSGIAMAAAIFIFCIFQFDLFGYDSYVPESKDVDSVALDMGPYQNYWEWNEENESINYLSDGEFIRNNMFLTDVEAVCELARKSQELDIQNAADCRSVSVLYRLKSGKEVSRLILVDFGDKSNEELLNRIIGTEEYRSGFYLMAREDVETAFEKTEREWTVTYTNGTIETDLPASESMRLREMWLKDMEQFDFTMANSERPCGKLSWDIYDSYTSMSVPVYENFDNTLSVLEEYHAVYPVELRAEDILSLEVTNWHYQDQEQYFSADGSYRREAASAYPETQHAVRKEFTDPDEIAEIVEQLYPSGTLLNLYWNDMNELDDGYNVTITFKMGTDYPYKRGYFEYKFLSGQVPDFVVERTAFEAEE